MTQPFRILSSCWIILWRQEVSHRIGISVCKANVITATDEDLLWSLGLLGMSHPEQLLNTVIFFVGKGFALCAGKEHRALCGLPFHSQFKFVKDSDEEIFLCYTEDIGLKTNKGAWSIRKLRQRWWICMQRLMRSAVPYEPLWNIWLSSLRTECVMPFIYNHGRNIAQRPGTWTDRWGSISFNRWLAGCAMQLAFPDTTQTTHWGPQRPWNFTRIMLINRSSWRSLATTLWP